MTKFIAVDEINVDEKKVFYEEGFDEARLQAIEDEIKFLESLSRDIDKSLLTTDDIIDKLEERIESKKRESQEPQVFAEKLKKDLNARTK